MPAAVRLIAHFRGDVQGVGFRYTTVHIARAYAAVSGHVRNLPDGRVQLVAEGQAADVEEFVAEVKAAMSSCIRETAVKYVPATGEYGAFRVGY